MLLCQCVNLPPARLRQRPPGTRMTRWGLSLRGQRNRLHKLRPQCGLCGSLPLHIPPETCVPAAWIIGGAAYIRVSSGTGRANGARVKGPGELEQAQQGTEVQFSSCRGCLLQTVAKKKSIHPGNGLPLDTDSHHSAK